MASRRRRRRRRTTTDLTPSSLPPSFSPRLFWRAEQQQQCSSVAFPWRFPPQCGGCRDCRSFGRTGWNWLDAYKGGRRDTLVTMVSTAMTLSSSSSSSSWSLWTKRWICARDFFGEKNSDCIHECQMCEYPFIRVSVLWQSSILFPLVETYPRFKRECDVKYWKFFYGFFTRVYSNDNDGVHHLTDWNICSRFSWRDAYYYCRSVLQRQSMAFTRYFSCIALNVDMCISRSVLFCETWIIWSRLVSSIIAILNPSYLIYISYDLYLTLKWEVFRYRWKFIFSRNIENSPVILA